MTRLRDLDAQLLRLERDGRTMREVDDLALAQGVMFECPKCFADNGGPVGTHYVICWFRDRGVPDAATPGPGRWNPDGTSLDDLTFVGPGAVSVMLMGKGCGWHGFIRNGEAT